MIVILEIREEEFYCTQNIISTQYSLCRKLNFLNMSGAKLNRKMALSCLLEYVIIQIMERFSVVIRKVDGPRLAAYVGSGARDADSCGVQRGIRRRTTDA